MWKGAKYTETLTAAQYGGGDGSGSSGSSGSSGRVTEAKQSSNIGCNVCVGRGTEAVVVVAA